MMTTELDAEAWIAIARGVIARFGNPSSSVFWGHLLSAAILAVLVYAVRRPDARPSVGGLVRFVLPPLAARRRAWHDVAVFAVNTIVLSSLFLPTIQLVSTTVGQGVWSFLYEHAGPVDEPWTGPWARAGMTVAVVVVGDVAFFLSHWLQHRVGVLWEFHKVHHSAEVLHPFTVFRRHPVDVVVESMLGGALIGALYGAIGWLSGGALSAFTIAGVNALLFAFLLLGFNLQHSHVRLSFGPLDRIFISPATHQLHHSTDPAHFGKNYGNVFAIWDGLIGSLHRPRAQPPVRFGLGGHEDADYRSLAALYFVPIVKAVRRLAPGMDPSLRAGRSNDRDAPHTRR